MSELKSTGAIHLLAGEVTKGDIPLGLMIQSSLQVPRYAECPMDVT
jgi:hypothetical protein